MKQALVILFTLVSLSLTAQTKLPDFTIYIGKRPANSWKRSGFRGGNFKSTRLPSVRINLYNEDGSSGSGGLDDATGDAELTERDKKREARREKIRNNPITRNLDFSWFREKYRMEKLFISIGIVSITMGVPFILSGTLCYIIQPTDQTDLGDTLYFALIGVGGGLMATGTGFVIGGAVSLYIKKKNNRIKVELYP